jgi:hypothetical protein
MEVTTMTESNNPALLPLLFPSNCAPLTPFSSLFSTMRLVEIERGEWGENNVEFDSSYVD